MMEGTTIEAKGIRLRQTIETQMRRRILEAIEVVLETCTRGAVSSTTSAW